jgi:hypothetical protein
MTILGVPDGGGFAIGTSANIAPSSGDAIDMSLGTSRNDEIRRFQLQK